MTPWREMNRLRREMNRLFDTTSYSASRAPTYPAVNVWLNEEGARVTAELPGVNPDDIDISVVGDTLTVSGCRNPQEYEEDASYHRRERGCGRFSRSFQLPFQVEANDVGANFENGVLSVDLPRAESDKPKKIEVKTG
jgi:HSP20 family protein